VGKENLEIHMKRKNDFISIGRKSMTTCQSLVEAGNLWRFNSLGLSMYTLKSIGREGDDQESI
jgi:hypothetical protein